MRRTAVLNIVGLTDSLLGPNTPRVTEFARRGARTSIIPAFPAVTCTAQANYLTGCPPSAHGIVGNGWYDREPAEVHFWKQSNHLVQAPKLWETLRARHPGFTCAKLFWWFNMYSSADYSVTPRPLYPADGRKVFDIHTQPAAFRPELKRALGEFPFLTFWGPAAGRETPAGGPDAATRWIAAAARWLERRCRPTLSLVYLPHLDYNLQRWGPAHPGVAAEVQRLDALVGELIADLQREGVQVVVLSEYGLSAVDTPVHLNRLFRAAGWLVIKDELGLEALDCGASQVFAVADHQVAHVYLNNRALEGQVRALLAEQPGVAHVLGHAEKAAQGLDHPRAGDLIAVAAERAWFTYYYWLDDRRAPDFARTVDIHRKPGYDPVELFLDPGLRAPRLKVAWRLLQRRLGFRMLMDVIPLDANLVRGSHGRRPTDPAEYPVFLADRPASLPPAPVESTEVAAWLMRLIEQA